MKTILKHKIKAFFALLFILTGMTFITACEEEETLSEVMLLSFGPSGVHHGDEITFFGQNLDKVTAIVFKPAVEVPKSAFNSSSKERINVTVPQAAEAGLVILKTPKGDIESKTILNFEVPVVLSSITPAEAKPGTNITITGEKINWIEQVTFTNDVIVTKDNFVSRSETQAVITVPFGAQTGFLIFSTGGTEPLTFGSEDQLIVTMPTVSGIAPTSIKHTENLTITGTNLDLITAVVFEGGDMVSRAGFVSQTETTIVVSVPATTVKGKLTLMQASPIDVVTNDELTIILPIGTAITPAIAVPAVDNVTITGTDLDLVAELSLSGSGTIAAASFLTHTSTGISFALPEDAKSGAIGYTTVHGFSGLLGVTLRVPAPGPAPLAITLYDETIAPGGDNWSWNGTSDVASGEQFYSGDVSWKFTSTDGGGLSAGGITAIDASSQGSFIFALYGGDLSGQSKVDVAVILNDNWSDYNSVKLVPGVWTEYEIPLTNFPTTNLAQITRFAFKVEGISNSTIYADYVGFDAKTTPPPLSIVVFDDVIADGLEPGGWGSGYTNFASTEVYRRGANPHAIKVNFPGGWGGGGQLVVPSDGSNISLAGMTKFAFSVYGGEGSDGKQIQVNLKVDADNPKTVTLQEGKWVDVEIPITDFAAITEFREIWFQDRGDAVTVYIDNIGFRP
ncbi:MAG: IPT/TIG domain-containing protein [Cyclobacteriaceae bacterium]|nr:IPT/TIG domain-containing protein [Cyclobacteriaceae bacterium]